MGNVLDGTVVSPLSNISLVRLSGDWRVVYTNAADDPYDFEVSGVPETLWSIVKPSADLSGIEPWMATLEIDITVKDVNNINFGFPFPMISASWFIPVSGPNAFKLTPSVLAYYDDVFPAQIQPERLALMKYDQETKMFSFPSKEPNLNIPPNTTEFWVETILEVGGLLHGDSTIVREYQNTAWLPSFEEPLLDGNKTKPTKVHRSIQGFIAGDPN